MAILAMEQYGLMLAGMKPALKAAASRTALLSRLRQRYVPIWMPSKMLMGRPEIAASWDVTSDSLAAWLAAELSASMLVLIKSMRVTTPPAATDLVRLGIVDRAFSTFLARSPCECRVFAAIDHRHFAEALHTGVWAGATVIGSPR
jgi:aspartokinase-like uncharacterized kinase